MFNFFVGAVFAASIPGQVSVSIRTPKWNDQLKVCSTDFSLLGIESLVFKDMEDGKLVTFCDEGDFDGNGSMDFFFQGDKEGPIKAVLLGNKETRTVIVTDHAQDLTTTTYHRKNSKTNSKLLRKQQSMGCPDFVNDGIIQWGEGGENHIYKYNVEKKSFEKDSQPCGDFD